MEMSRKKVNGDQIYMDTDPGATKHVSGDWRGEQARDET